MTTLSPTILPPERLAKKNKIHPLGFFLVGMGIFLLASTALLLVYPQWKQKILEPENRQSNALKLEAKQYEEQLKESQTESKRFREQIMQYETQVREYQREMARLRDQIKTSVAERGTLKKELKAKEDQVTQAWERVKTVEELLGKSLTPRVMKINHEFNYVVMNMGRTNQIHLGDKLKLERAGRTTATVEIEKLYDSFSSARIIQESKEFPIREGDSVETLA